MVDFFVEMMYCNIIKTKEIFMEYIYKVTPIGLKKLSAEEIMKMKKLNIQNYLLKHLYK